MTVKKKKEKSIDYKNMIHEIVEKNSASQTPENRKQFEKTILDIVENGKSPAEAMGFGKAELEALYAFGYDNYTIGKYEMANQVFRFLVSVENDEPKYWMGLAASYHRLKNYQRAIDFYMATLLFNPQDPFPFYYAAECFLKLKQPLPALVMLQSTIERCKEIPQMQIIKERCKRMMDQVNEEYGKKPAKAA